jgi:hypothetical protein
MSFAKALGLSLVLLIPASFACQSSRQSSQQKLLIYTPHGQDMLVRSDIDRKQLPDWMNTPFTRMPLDWDLLRKQGNEWLRYWDTEIRGRSK